MKKYIVLIVLFLAMFCNVNNVYARSGCCSHHGGVSGACSNGKQVCNDGTTSPSCTCSSSSSSSSSGSTYTPSYIYGCTDKDSINYNSSANKDDGSCIKIVLGCTDSNAYNYNSSANKDDGSCISKVYGCMDQLAVNYNNTANTSDGSCLFESEKISYKKIKYKTKYKFSFFKRKGTVLKKGKKGKKKIIEKVTTDESGNVIKSEKVKEEIIKKPVNKIVTTNRLSN